MFSWSSERLACRSEAEGATDAGEAAEEQKAACERLVALLEEQDLPEAVRAALGSTKRMHRVPIWHAAVGGASCMLALACKHPHPASGAAGRS